MSTRHGGSDLTCRRCGVKLGMIRRGALDHFKTAPGVEVRYLENGDLELICPCGFETIFRWDRKEAA